jgi:DNA-binding IscR family transcriptional regulator
MTSSRFTVAIHILTLLAFCGREALTSEFIAGSVNTNPVVVRRLLAILREARLVASQGGPGGGWHLLRDPRELDLGQVFEAVEGSALFPLHAATPNPRCPVGKHIQEALAGIFQEAQAALAQNLSRTTIAALVQDVTTLAS